MIHQTELYKIPYSNKYFKQTKNFEEVTYSNAEACCIYKPETIMIYAILNSRHLEEATDIGRKKRTKKLLLGDCYIKFVTGLVQYEREKKNTLYLCDVTVTLVYL